MLLMNYYYEDSFGMFFKGLCDNHSFEQFSNYQLPVWARAPMQISAKRGPDLSFVIESNFKSLVP